MRRVFSNHMAHWAYILAAYALVAAILLGYWARVERGIRLLEGAERP